MAQNTKDKQAKKANKGGGTSEVNRKRTREGLIESGGEEMPSEEPKTKKKRQNKKQSTPLADNEDDPEDYVTMTAYIRVSTSSAPPAPKTRGKPAAPVYHNIDPFEFKTTDDYDTFIEAIAQALPCPVRNVPKEKITWFANKPLNFREVGLGGPVGYKGLISEFKGRSEKQGLSLTLTMPPPSKDANPKPVSDTHST